MLKQTKRFLLLLAAFLASANLAFASANPIEFKFLGVPVKERAERLLEFLLSIVGSIAFLFLIGAGIFYAASNGNPDGQLKAKRMLIAALEGIVVVSAAYILIAFVTRMLTE